MEIKLNQTKNVEYQELIQKLIENGKGDLTRIVSEWVQDERSLSFLGDTELENDLSKSVYLVFSENGHEVAEAQISTKTILEDFPDIRILVPTPLPARKGPLDFECETDDEFYEKRDKLLRITWNEEVYEQVISFQNSIKLALGNVLCGYGEVNLCPADINMFADCPLDLDLTRLINLHLVVVDTSRTFSMNEHLYTFR